MSPTLFGKIISAMPPSTLDIRAMAAGSMRPTTSNYRGNAAERGLDALRGGYHLPWMLSAINRLVF